jgi:hypothetical protein
MSAAKNPTRFIATVVLLGPGMETWMTQSKAAKAMVEDLTEAQKKNPIQNQKQPAALDKLSFEVFPFNESIPAEEMRASVLTTETSQKVFGQNKLSTCAFTQRCMHLIMKKFTAEWLGELTKANKVN